MAVKVRHSNCVDCGKEIFVRSQDLRCGNCLSNKYSEVFRHGFSISYRSRFNHEIKEILNEEIIF